LGIGDWGLGIGPNPQSPIPNPQILKLHKTIISYNYIFINENLINNYNLKYFYYIMINYSTDATGFG